MWILSFLFFLLALMTPLLYWSLFFSFLLHFNCLQYVWPPFSVSSCSMFFPLPLSHVYLLSLLWSQQKCLRIRPFCITQTLKMALLVACTSDYLLICTVYSNLTSLTILVRGQALSWAYELHLLVVPEDLCISSSHWFLLILAQLYCRDMLKYLCVWGEMACVHDRTLNWFYLSVD